MIINMTTGGKMKKLLKICLIVVIGLVFIRATCGKIKPVNLGDEFMSFTDAVYFHNMSITYGNYELYTLNGGNDEYSIINKYDDTGEYVETYDLEIDGRTIFYNPNDDNLYAKCYDTGLYKLDLENADYEIVKEDAFESANSSVGFSPDGKYIYEFNNGNVRVIDFDLGEQIKTLKIKKYYDVEPYNLCIAASANNLFIWGAEDKILVYDFKGKLVNSIELSKSYHPFSLSYGYSMLWLAEDADGSTDITDGIWHSFPVTTGD